MAFITPMQVLGRSYTAAYVKASIVRSDKEATLVQLEVWETQALREQSVPPLQMSSPLRSFPTQLSLPSDNPVDYAYKLLEASGEFPDATWNI